MIETTGDCQWLIILYESLSIYKGTTLHRVGTDLIGDHKLVFLLQYLDSAGNFTAFKGV